MMSLTGTAIAVSVPVMRRIKASNGASSLNSVSFFGQKRSFPSSLRLSISCSAKQETIDKVYKIVQEQLDVDKTEIKGYASFINDLGADSLDLVELVMALEESFGITIDEESAQSISTVDQAIDTIEKLIENK